MKLLISCSLLVILLTSVGQWYFGTIMFKEESPKERMKNLLWLVLSGSPVLVYLSIYILVSNGNEGSNLSENIKWLFFIGIIVVSIVPLIIINKFKKERFIFDTLKPIVNGIAVISTIFLFLIKTFGHIQHELGDFSFNALANDIGYVIVQSLPFLIYPCSIAFTLGEYFVKYEQLKQEQQKQEQPKQEQPKQGQQQKKKKKK
ncbi:hypothetical protein [Cytobacillus firmus]|uniref:hypothetical protein n=1 Tax=Cytobacillus firmus TaxID=1399 RepID=UPI0018CFB26B|nr:hypothetical protein [Cytobacillus firmus]MBG9444026.1 hypothetical protein [Cytobacillus firmus]